MPNDYINPEDGLLYCGKCHIPKQTKVNFRGRTDIQYCLCACEKKRIEEEKAERKKEQVIADNRRQERSKRAGSKAVNLLIELDNGVTGHITGEISSKE